MDYTQDKLIELLKSGSIPGETRKPQHLETAISNLFLFTHNVYKVYKTNNEFFNKNFRNLADKAERFSFTRKDFAWNTALSPSIYRELKGVSVVDGQLVLHEAHDSAQELLFVMNRFDSNDVLYEKLIHREISEVDAYTIGRHIASSLRAVQSEVLDGNFFEIFDKEIHDVRVWGMDIAEFVPPEELHAYCNYLDAFRIESRDWFEGELSTQVRASGDAHSHNVVYSHGATYLIDSYAPKEDWAIAHEHTVFYRIAADILALGGEELYEACRRGYEKELGRAVDRRLDPLFIIYASTIMVSYLYMLQKTDEDKKEAAHRYHEFIRNYYRKVVS